MSRAGTHRYSTIAAAHAALHRWPLVRAETRQRLPVINPSTEETIVEVEAGGRRRCRSRRARGIARISRLEADDRAPSAQVICGRSRAASKRTANISPTLQSLNNGKPHSRSAHRRRRRGRDVRLLRGPRRNAGRQRKKRSRSRAAIIARVIRREPAAWSALIVPWNFPDGHDRVEARPRARRGMHGRAEALRSHAAAGARTGRRSSSARVCRRAYSTS